MENPSATCSKPTTPRRKPGLPRRVLALWAIALSLWANAAPVQAFELGQRVQWPAMQTLDATPVDAASLNGRYVFLQVWASWCPYCKLQNASLPALQARWEQRGGTLITLATDRNAGTVRDYMDVKNLRFPVVHATPALRAWLGKIRSVPTVFIIGPDGSVLKKIEGQMLEEDLMELPDLLPHAQPSPRSGSESTARPTR